MVSLISDNDLDKLRQEVLLLRTLVAMVNKARGVEREVEEMEEVVGCKG